MSQASKHSKSIASNFIIRSELFFELFPFHIIFKRSLEIISIGDGLNQAMKNIEGETLRDLFNINRPMIHAFTWENVILRLNDLVFLSFFIIYLKIILHANNIFELVTIEPVRRQSTPTEKEFPESSKIMPIWQYIVIIKLIFNLIKLYMVLILL